MTPAPTPPSATALADAVVARLVAAGVGHVVLAPGSRNAPLAYAVWGEVHGPGRLELHTRIDERTAGFLALGLTKVGARAAVVCTSGTAVANLHPAVLEAAHAGLPLVVLTADRPARLRGTGANQTTDQVGIFGRLVTTYDVAAPADLDGVPWDSPGVLHVNVQLDLPLVPTSSPASWSSESGVVAGPPSPRPPTRATTRPDSTNHEARFDVLPQGPRTVVVAGDEAGPPARVLAEAGGWPLLAEPTSGARTGHNALRCYRLLLGTDLGREVERVVVVGRPTISRPVTELLQRPDVEVLVVPAAGVWPVRPLGATPPRPGPACRGRGRPGVARAVARGRPGGRPPGRPAARRAARDDAVRRRRRGVARAAPRRPARRRRLQPGARPRPDGAAGAGGGSGAGWSATVAWPASTAPSARPSVPRSAGRTQPATSPYSATSPSSTTRPAWCSDRTSGGPTSPSSSSTTTAARSSRSSSRAPRSWPTPSSGSSALRTGSTSAPSAPPPAPRTCGVTSLPELEQALASPNGGLEVVEAVVGRADRRELDAAIRGLAG
ncbi:thiamine pyrophosphate-binding protein [Nocardioides sp. TF02-7]|uniref:thiamine pyrophosphate-binding protein n=1 Tax=Nocardioides sp. TF02-7 TaxID=2917724 RepID=UPI001F052448|nr:thiamine pyrophosphate-binding protein [Nocardioides sp. TF02-7]UMG93836.1 2-succinyl-5-enolpyruvyl-6-hydroxy-3-cyclohexene-1-carboxylate synthase [Nocardioides sp. TF02-7]